MGIPHVATTKCISKRRSRVYEADKKEQQQQREKSSAMNSDRKSKCSNRHDRHHSPNTSTERARSRSKELTRSRSKERTRSRSKERTRSRSKSTDRRRRSSSSKILNDDELTSPSASSLEFFYDDRQKPSSNTTNGSNKSGSGNKSKTLASTRSSSSTRRRPSSRQRGTSTSRSRERPHQATSTSKQHQDDSNDVIPKITQEQGDSFRSPVAPARRKKKSHDETRETMHLPTSSDGDRKTARRSSSRGISPTKRRSKSSNNERKSTSRGRRERDHLAAGERSKSRRRSSRSTERRTSSAGRSTTTRQKVKEEDEAKKQRERRPSSRCRHSSRSSSRDRGSRNRDHSADDGRRRIRLSSTTILNESNKSGETKRKTENCNKEEEEKRQKRPSSTGRSSSRSRRDRSSSRGRTSRSANRVSSSHAAKNIGSPARSSHQRTEKVTNEKANCSTEKQILSSGDRSNRNILQTTRREQEQHRPADENNRDVVEDSVSSLFRIIHDGTFAPNDSEKTNDMDDSNTSPLYMPAVYKTNSEPQQPQYHRNYKEVMTPAPSRKSNEAAAREDFSHMSFGTIKDWGDAAFKMPHLLAPAKEPRSIMQQEVPGIIAMGMEGRDRHQGKDHREIVVEEQSFVSEITFVPPITGDSKKNVARRSTSLDHVNFRTAAAATTGSTKHRQDVGIKRSSSDRCRRIKYIPKSR